MDIVYTQSVFFCPTLFVILISETGIWLLDIKWKLNSWQPSRSVGKGNQHAVSYLISISEKCRPQNGSPFLILVRENPFLMRKLNSFSSEQVHDWSSVQTWRNGILPSQVYPVRAQCQPTQLWRWFCLGSVTIWPGKGCYKLPSTLTTLGLERTKPLETFPSGQKQWQERCRMPSGESLSGTSGLVLEWIILFPSFGKTSLGCTQTPR